MLILFFLIYLGQGGQISLNLVELFPVQKGISLSTNYELKVLLERSLNSTSKIGLDFSKSDITMQDGFLTTCLDLDIVNENNQVVYQNCSCVLKQCTIITTNNLAKGVFFWLRFGLLNNPTFVNDEQVSLRMDYAGGSDFSIYPITITSDIFQAGFMNMTSLSQSSFKVNAINDICLGLITAHPIDASGNLRITFPSQVSFSQNITVKALVNGTNITGALTITIPNSQVLISQLFTSQVTQFTLFILSTLNPQSIQVSNSFTIESFTSNMNLEDSISSSIVIQVNFPETIKINYVGVYPGQPTTVLTNTAFYFSIQPAVSFSGGGHLEIEFPPEIQMTNQTKCNKILGLAIYQGNTYNCLTNGQVVQTVNLQYPTSNTQLLMMVLGVVTPSSTKPTGSFKFRTYDVNGNLICLSTQLVNYTASTNQITISQLLRSNTVVGNRMQLSFTFQSQTPVINGYFLIKLPNYQSIQDTSNSLLCSINGTMTSCIINDATQNLNIPDVNGWIRIRAPLPSQILTFTILQGLMNPPFVPNSQGIVSIQTYTSDDWLVDQSSVQSSITPPLTPITMSFFNLARLNSIQDAILPTSNVIVNSPIVLMIDVPSPSNYFNTMDGNIILNFNSVMSYALGSQLYCQIWNTTQFLNRSCSVTQYFQETPQLPSLNLVKQLMIQSICDGANQNFCMNKSDFNITIMGLKSSLAGGNFNSSQMQSSIQMTTQDGSYISIGQQTIGTLNYVNQIQTISKLTYQLQSQITGMITTWSLSFICLVPLDIIDRGGSFQISGIPFQNNSNCLASINSIFLLCSYNSSFMVIQQSGLDPNIFLGASINLSITQVLNPSSLKPTLPLVISQYYNSTFLSSQGQIIVQASQARTLQASINRIQSQLGQPTSLLIQYLIENQIQEQSYIVVITLPMDQLLLASLQVLDSFQNVIPDQITFTQTEYVIQFRIDDCPCNQLLVNITLNGFTNVATSKTFSSNAQISIQTLDNFGYQASQQIQITPALTTGKVSLSFSQTGQSVNQKTQISLFLALSTVLTNSSLSLQFSPSIFTNQQPQIILNNAPNLCSLTVNRITCQNLSLTNLQLTMQIVQINSTQFLVDNPQLSLNVSTMTNDNFILDTSVFDISSLLNLAASTINLQYVTPTISYTLSTSQLILSFLSPTLMPTSTDIFLSVPYFNLGSSTSTPYNLATLTPKNNSGFTLLYSTSQVYNLGDLVPIYVNQIILPRYTQQFTSPIVLQIISHSQTTISYQGSSLPNIKLQSALINSTMFVKGNAGQLNNWQLQLQLPFIPIMGEQIIIRLPQNVFPLILTSECPNNSQNNTGQYTDSIFIAATNSSQQIIQLCLINPFISTSSVDVYLMLGQKVAAHGTTIFQFTPVMTNSTQPIQFSRTISYVNTSTSLEIQIPINYILIPAQSQITFIIPNSQILFSKNIQCYQDNSQVSCSQNQGTIQITPFNLCPSQQTSYCRLPNLNFTIQNLINPSNIYNASSVLGITTNIGKILSFVNGVILPLLTIQINTNTLALNLDLQIIGSSVFYTQTASQLVLSFTSPIQLNIFQIISIQVPYFNLGTNSSASLSKASFVNQSNGGFNLSINNSQLYNQGDLVTIQIYSVILPRYVQQLILPITLQIMSDDQKYVRYLGSTLIPIQIKVSTITTVMQVNQNQGQLSNWILQVSFPFDPLSIETILVKFPLQIFPSSLRTECTNNQTSQGDYIDFLSFTPQSRFQTLQLCLINPFKSVASLDVYLIQGQLIAAQGLISFNYTPAITISTQSIQFNRSIAYVDTKTSLQMIIPITNTIIPAQSQITLIIPNNQFLFLQNFQCFQDNIQVTCVQQNLNQIQLTSSNLCPLQQSQFCRINSINLSISNLINPLTAFTLTQVTDITTQIGSIIQFVKGIALPNLLAKSEQLSSNVSSIMSTSSTNSSNVSKINLQFVGPNQTFTLSTLDIALQFLAPSQLNISSNILIQLPYFTSNDNTSISLTKFNKTHWINDEGLTLQLKTYQSYNMGDLITIQINSLISPRYTQDLIDLIKIQIQTNDTNIVQGSSLINTKISPSLINSLVFMSGNQGEQSKWQLQVQLPFSTEKKDILVIKFPSMTFPKSLSIECDRGTYNYTDEFLSSISIEPGQKYNSFDLCLVNPFEAVSQIKLELSHEQKLAASGIITLKYFPTLQNSILQTTILRSNTQINSTTNLQILIPINNSIIIPQQTQIMITIPTSQFIMSSTMVCYINGEHLNLAQDNNNLVLSTLNLCQQQLGSFCNFSMINITVLNLINPSQIYKIEQIEAIDIQFGQIIHFQNGIAFPLLTNLTSVYDSNKKNNQRSNNSDSETGQSYFGPASILTLIAILGLIFYIVISMVKLPYQPFLPALIMSALVVLSVSRTLQLVVALAYGMILQQTFAVFLQASTFCVCVLHPFLQLQGQQNSSQTVSLLTAGQMDKVSLSKLFGKSKLQLSQNIITDYLAVRSQTSRIPQIILSILINIIGIGFFSVESSEESYLFGLLLLNDALTFTFLLMEKYKMSLVE